jgi:tRNA/rRNA methyltransferase/tRNA (cytidine32/uridine32-2'-O)-methyltransferase
MVRIPANPDYSSLNLAAAVQILSYELRLAALATEELSVEESTLPAPAEELERFYTHLQDVLLEYDFLDPNNPRHLMRRLRRLFGRALPDQTEINILRGILSAVQNSKK